MCDMLYSVDKAFSVPNPTGDTVVIDAGAFRGSYRDLGAWALPLVVRPEGSTIIPQTAPLALPAMPHLTPVSIYSV